MADHIKLSKLPFAITRGLFFQPSSSLLPLSINRRHGSLANYTYVYAGKLPLRIESRISDRSSSDALPLAITRPHQTILPARYIASNAIPLAITVPLSDKPIASALPLAIKQEHGTLLVDKPTNSNAQKIELSGWVSSSFSNNIIKHLDRQIQPSGFDSAKFGFLVIQSKISEGYYLSDGLKLPIAVSAAIRPPSSELPLGIYREHGQWLSRPEITSTNRQYTYPKTFIANTISQPKISLYQQYIATNSIDSFFTGTPVVKNSIDIISYVGWQSSIVSNAIGIVNRNQRITLQGFVSSLYGYQKTYNLLQYTLAKSFDASSYGIAYLQGGVEYLSPTGLLSELHGRTVATNTTAVQELNPTGIINSAMPAPNVSPRIVYPIGIVSLSMGVTGIYDPAIKPIGLQYASYGNPTIWYHTRLVAPNSMLGFESGYPRVADPTQFVQPLSLVTSAIFGDTATRNMSFKVSAPAILDGGFSDYTVITNSNRYYDPKGINSLSIGIVSIANGTPELFASGITSYAIGTPAIGYAIRVVQPTGFDHLLLGLAVLTKTPELKPRSFDSLSIGDTTVWYKNREIKLSQQGIDSFTAGTISVWYGQRPLAPKSWQSANYGKPTLTHEVREIIGSGFSSAAYGTTWVSCGTRVVELVGIYKEFASNHMVGGTQTVLPAGYIATLFGTRIIPDNQTASPRGFVGVFGDTTIDLSTKYLLPIGYISVGEQDADRFGDSVAYNKRQYIIQEFDINSGLVPPKWSDYLMVENRDRVIGASSLNSQKFGYSQIDNNAAPLLPKGIEPPVGKDTLVAYAVRQVALDGIEPPPISTWAVAYNDARVIITVGVSQSLYGNEAVVVKTRREYRNVGRIDSLETGTPMIAYRIRTIDIEPRYSIAPPQINLPTVDLYTRYIEFNGYETAKYGYPALNIELRVIAPKWTHKDKQGYPALRNLTPDLGIYGHDSQEFGRASIRTQWRNIYAQGATATLFGLQKIEDTKKSIQVRGWQDSAVSQQHNVVKTGAPPYTPQNIWLQNENDITKDGFGIEPPKGQVSTPGLNQNVLYHKGHNSQKFGTAFIYSNNILIDSGIGVVSDAVPKPTLINKNRTISAEGMDYTIKAGVPRLSPHTIYAVKEAPLQAVLNHPTSADAHYVNSNKGTRPPGEVFGRASVESTIRSIQPAIFPILNIKGFGFAKTELALSIIKPSSFSRSRFGIPAIPFTLQDISIREGISSSVFGSAVVDRPPYIGPQTINLNGIYASVFGQTYSDNYVRTLQSKGFISQDMGASKPGDTPFMWQSLRVGEHIPIIVSAGDTLLFGDATIGLRVRDISLQGFVAFSSGYSLESFYGRMTVVNSDKKLPATQGVGVIGIEQSSTIGKADIKYGQQFIRPDGNSDQFRKGGHHA